MSTAAPALTSFAARYRRGEWRSAVFADMVLAELAARDRGATVLDIGCGGGFDGDLALQRRIGMAAGRFIGVEPDPQTEVADCFHEVHRAILEDAPVRTASVDVAYAVMVAEHVEAPGRFLARVADVLAPGGVFWAFTVDLRHWSSWVSLAMDRVRIKDAYLDRMHGRRGEDRWANFPVHYRLNRPADVRRWGDGRLAFEFVNLFRVGAEDDNLPGVLRPLNRWLDRCLDAVGAPGSNLAFRATRLAAGQTSSPLAGGRP